MQTIPAELAQLAEARGVATSYEDTAHRRHPVAADTVRAVLAALDIDATTPEAVATELHRARTADLAQLAPPSVVVRCGDPGTVPLHLPIDAGVDARLLLEDRSARVLAELGPVTRQAEHQGRTVTRRRLHLPADLPTGYHELSVGTREGYPGQARATVIVAPAACPQPPSEPAWGFMAQLYALRSRSSWGIGDLGDLRTLAAATGHAGGAFVLVNPLHAHAPVIPLEPSPYYPSSRRFADPLYLRIEDLPELAAAPSQVRERIGRIATRERERNRGDRIDRDAAWAAKRDALTLLHGVPLDRARSSAFAAWRDRRGAALTDFATFCALAEAHGTPWQSWPAALRHPAGSGVASARAELAQRIEFHVWLQFCCDEQLAAAQRDGTAAGMPLGIIHDLAVGVDPGGADAWALQDDLATAATVGAPPDPFNQQGQDWRLPPLRPDRLAETAYGPFRDVLSGGLRHGGGIRIDHVMGLFRQWWIPAGQPPTAGTYVRYPARELLAVLALEAERAGAIVVGEDLGTVEDGVRTALSHAGVLSSRVVYFERTEQPTGRRLRADEYHEHALATITTHDLPTPAGWWADEEVRTQGRLGLLAANTTLESELARKAAERAEMAELLRAESLLGADPTPEELVAALHAFLAHTRSLLVAVAPGDALGDRRQPNLPGTTDEYPNWRLPAAEPAPEGHRPVLLEDLLADPRLHALVRLLTDGRTSVRSTPSRP